MSQFKLKMDLEQKVPHPRPHLRKKNRFEHWFCLKYLSGVFLWHRAQSWSKNWWKIQLPLFFFNFFPIILLCYCLMDRLFSQSYFVKLFFAWPHAKAGSSPWWIYFIMLYICIFRNYRNGRRLWSREQVF